jgi:hypothetical protein
MISLRLPPDLAEGLRRHADGTGTSVSDLLRRAALELLGTCPTCGQPVKKENA